MHSSCWKHPPHSYTQRMLGNDNILDVSDTHQKSYWDWILLRWKADERRTKMRKMCGNLRVTIMLSLSSDFSSWTNSMKGSYLTSASYTKAKTRNRIKQDKYCRLDEVAYAAERESFAFRRQMMNGILSHFFNWLTQFRPKKRNQD